MDFGVHARTTFLEVRSPSLYPLSYGRHQEFRAAALTLTA